MRDDPERELRPGLYAARRTAAWVRTLPGLVWSHAPLAVVLSGAIVLRTLAIAAIHPALFFYGDSFSYISNARHLKPEITRPMLYPVFLRLLGAASGHLEPAIVAQHLMGLGCGIALYVLLRRLGIGRWLATLGVVPVLLDPYQLNLEHQVMSEALFSGLVVGSMMALLWRERPSIRACAGAGALIAAAALVRSTGIVLVVPAILVAAFRRFDRRRVAALAAAFVIPLAMYASWFKGVNGSFALSKYDGRFLYGLVAPIVDCTRLRVPQYERSLCDLRPPQMRPDANFYVWMKDSPARNVDVPPGLDKDSVLRDFAVRAIIQQPARYARQVTDVVLHFFNPHRAIGRLDFTDSPWRFSLIPPDRHRVHDAIVDLGAPYQDPVFWRGPVQALARYQRTFYTWGPLLALFMLAGFSGAAGMPRGSGRSLRAESLALAVGGLLMLLIPAMTVMFDYRYGIPALVLLPPSGAIGLHVLATRAREYGLVERLRALLPV